MISSELVAAMAMSEVGAGSDLQGVRTTARRDGDDFGDGRPGGTLILRHWHPTPEDLSA